MEEHFEREKGTNESYTKKSNKSNKKADETESADRHCDLYRYCVDIMGSQRRIFSGRADRKAWV